MAETSGSNGNRRSAKGEGQKLPAQKSSKRSNRGRRSRELTRQKLVDAAERAIAEHGVERTTIVDITEEADVGIGSFYNNFSTKNEIVELIFKDHARALAAVNSDIFEQEEDPALAIVYIQKIFLTKAIHDPVWGWFVVHATSDMPQMVETFWLAGREHLEAGQAKGRFAPADLDVAMRIILSSLIAGMRDLLEKKGSSKESEPIIQSLLMMLGVEKGEAEQLSRADLPAYVAKRVEPLPS